MAFKRSAVRSRLSPPKRKGTPKGVPFRFVSMLRVEPGAAKQRPVTLRQPQSCDRLWGLPCLEYDGFVDTARSGRRKPRVQSSRLSPPNKAGASFCILQFCYLGKCNGKLCSRYIFVGVEISFIIPDHNSFIKNFFN